MCRELQRITDREVTCYSISAKYQQNIDIALEWLIQQVWRNCFVLFCLFVCLLVCLIVTVAARREATLLFSGGMNRVCGRHR